jgi:hypothetical protein
MQKLIVALALSGAAAFVAPSAQRASLRVNAEEETAAPEPAAAPAPAAPAKKTGTSNRKDTITPSKSAGGLDLAGLQALAYEQNPIVGYFDPLELSLKEFFDESNTATIGFLRQAELKHGRVAMAGFVGYLVHAQGITWPFKMTLDGADWPTLGEGGVPALWDQIPEGAKWQIITAIGCLEWYDEWQYDNPAAQMPAMADKPKHYMRGGQPGAYPRFDGLPLNLYDPFNLFKKASEEKKARGRNAEVNNGRLAMIGLFSLIAESKVPGSVPFLDQFDFPAYAGNVMVPFEGQFSLLG